MVILQSNLSVRFAIIGFMHCIALKNCIFCISEKACIDQVRDLNRFIINAVIEHFHGNSLINELLTLQDANISDTIGSSNYRFETSSVLSRLKNAGLS